MATTPRLTKSVLYVFARSSYPLPNFHISGTSSPSTSSSATEAIANETRLSLRLETMVIVIKERKWDRRAIRVLTRLLVSCQTRGDRRLRRIDFNLLFDGSLHEPMNSLGISGTKSNTISEILISKNIQDYFQLENVSKNNSRIIYTLWLNFQTLMLGKKKIK